MKKVLLSLLASVLFLAQASANSNVRDALVYSTINSAIATGTAIGLQRAGYQTQTVVTPFGAQTVIVNNTDNLSNNTQNTARPTQSEINQQRMDFMNN